MTTSLIARFAPHLNLVREYASVSANCRVVGDDVVKGVLKGLSDNILFHKGLFDARLELLRRVHLALADVIPSQSDKPVAGGSGVSELLAAYPNPTRQIVFLHHVAHLSEAEIGLVTGLEPDAVLDFIEAAEDTIWPLRRVRVLIVEDDIWIANHLRELLEEDGHEVVGIAKTQAAAMQLAEKTQPELLICDVNLEDGSSGIASAIDLQRNGRIPTIFVTAFPHMVRTLRPLSCTAIISKPFSENEIRTSVSRALDVNRAA